MLRELVGLIIGSVLLVAFFFIYLFISNIGGIGCDGGWEANGVHVIYAVDGSKSRSMEMQNCLSHGLQIDYYPSDRIKREGYYVKGVKRGDSKVYDEQGVLICYQRYQGGDFIGLYTSEESPCTAKLNRIQIDSLKARYPNFGGRISGYAINCVDSLIHSDKGVLTFTEAGI